MKEQSIVVNRGQAYYSTMKEGEIGRDVYIMQDRKNMVSGVTVVHPRSRTRGHAHPRREEHYYILSGAGYIMLDDERHDFTVGADLYIPPRSTHTVVNPNDEPLEFFWAAFADEPKITR